MIPFLLKGLPTQDQVMTTLLKMETSMVHHKEAIMVAHEVLLEWVDQEEEVQWVWAHEDQCDHMEEVALRWGLVPLMECSVVHHMEEDMDLLTEALGLQVHQEDNGSKGHLQEAWGAQDQEDHQ